ncbi:precorrin-2 dehydrogenase/sirohydrochlorin ferrochelatase family protein [Streptococcus sp. 10F2]
MYPIMVNLTGKSVVVVGGGQVAVRKVEGLLQAGAKVTVVSPELHPKLQIADVIWINRAYQKGDLDDAFLVFACTNQDLVNQAVYCDALPSQLVNNTGNKFESDFYNVAWADLGDVSVMISTQGQSPSRAKQLRKEVIAFLREHMEE